MKNVYFSPFRSNTSQHRISHHSSFLFCPFFLRKYCVNSFFFSSFLFFCFCFWVSAHSVWVRLCGCERIMCLRRRRVLHSIYLYLFIFFSHWLRFNVNHLIWRILFFFCCVVFVVVLYSFHSISFTSIQCVIKNRAMNVCCMCEPNECERANDVDC